MIYGRELHILIGSESVVLRLIPLFELCGIYDGLTLHFECDGIAMMEAEYTLRILTIFLSKHHLSGPTAGIGNVYASNQLPILLDVKRPAERQMRMVVVINEL